MSIDIIELNKTNVMSLQEANHRIRIIIRFTATISAEVNLLMTHLDNMADGDDLKAQELEKQIDDKIQLWNQKVERLGGVPRGLWLVDLDAGDGYYCWKYPEPEIAYWHEYKSGFTGRVPLESRSVEVKNESRTSTDQPHTW